MRTPSTICAPFLFETTHCNLGSALQLRGLFQEAVVQHRRGHELGRKSVLWLHPSAQWVRDAERMAEFASRLPTLLAEGFQPADADVGILMARVCSGTKHYPAAARYYTAAFAAKPKLATEFIKQHRCAAASAAVLAGSGVGTDAHKLGDAERSKLRRQALEWLQADLAVWAKIAHKPDLNPEGLLSMLASAAMRDAGVLSRGKARLAMQHWQRDPDFVGVRDIAALGKLPGDEISGWVKLWADVADLLRRTEEPQAGEKPDKKPNRTGAVARE